MRKRTVDIRDKDFCSGCKNEKLSMHTESILQSDGSYKHCKYVSCQYIDICTDLFERFMSALEQSDEDFTYDVVCDEDSDDDLLDDDYSFCTDTRKEDRKR